MLIRDNRFLKNAISALGITLFALLLSTLMLQPFSFSTGALMSQHEKKDFKVTDFYNIVADSREVRTLDNDIVLVNIDNADRLDIAMLIDRLATVHPRAVGVDITFDHPGDADVDRYLQEAIAKCPNIIQSVGVSQDPIDEDMFQLDDHSFFFNRSSGKPHGVVNLPMKMGGGLVRQFAVKYHISNGGGYLWSFPCAVASVVSPEAIHKLEKRDHNLELINYPSRLFRKIDYTELDSNLSVVDDKIVLIGALNEDTDMHNTPLGNRLSGLEIHAYALSTILNHNYLSAFPQWLNVLFGVLVCFLFMLINLNVAGPYRGIMLRLVQVTFLYIILLVSYHLFVDIQLQIDFSFTILMLTFGLFAYDIWTGGTHFVQWIYKKYRRYSRGYETTH